MCLTEESLERGIEEFIKFKSDEIVRLKRPKLILPAPRYNYFTSDIKSESGHYLIRFECCSGCRRIYYLDPKEELEFVKTALPAKMPKAIYEFYRMHYFSQNPDDILCWINRALFGDSRYKRPKWVSKLEKLKILNKNLKFKKKQRYKEPFHKTTDSYKNLSMRRYNDRMKAIAKQKAKEEAEYLAELDYFR